MGDVGKGSGIYKISDLWKHRKALCIKDVSSKASKRLIFAGLKSVLIHTEKSCRYSIVLQTIFYEC